MIKDKVLAALGLKYKGKGLSKTFLDQTATIIAAGITEESEIDAKIADFDGFIVSAANEGNRRATEAAQRAKLTNEPAPVDPADPATPPAPAPAPAPKGDEVPAWAKALLDEVKTLKAEKTQQTIKEKFVAAIGKDVPESFYKRVALPQTEEEVEALAAEIKTDWTALKQENNNLGLGNDRPASAGAPASTEKPSDAELDNIVDGL